MLFPGREGSLPIKCPRCHRENPNNTRYCGSCGTRFPTAADPSVTQTQFTPAPLFELSVGSTFAGRFLVLEEIGRGGMGRVYRVLDKKLDVEIALKLINPEIGADEHIIERFKNELRLTRIISHPNVCRMYDLSEDQGGHYITMEFVPGENLKSTLHRFGSLSARRALTIAKQICQGLGAAHHLDIVHRDLKPQNIMLDRSGNVRIMDFGISRSLRAKGITAEGVMIGTPEYISPEQADGSKVDSRTDIYSFGAILFEMVTGKVPFEGDTTLSIVLKQKLEPPPDPTTLAPHLPKDIGRIILKCLEKDRDDRYPSVEALLADLEKAEQSLKDEETAATKAATKSAGRPRKPRKLLVPSLAVALVAVVALGIVILGRGKNGPAGAEEVAKTAIPVPSPPEQSAAASNLEIGSTPSGASVYINAKLEGTTPLKRELPPGDYELKISDSPGYRDATEKVTVKPGEPLKKNFALSPVYLLEVVSVPDGADIYIDGAPRGRTPRELEIAANSCRVELRKGEGWPVIAETLKLTPGRNSFRRTFRAQRFGLRISTIPSDALVSIGNGAPERAPIDKTVERGVYPVKVEREGYRTRQESVSVEADVDKTFELAKLEPGKVRINVNPYADVFINENPMGEFPPVKTIELAEGKYTLRFVSSGLNKTLTVELDMKAGANKEVRVNMLTGESKIIDI
jgi:serine/threonine protein kinase